MFLANLAGADTRGETGKTVTRAHALEPILGPLEKKLSLLSPGSEMGLKGESVKAQIATIKEKNVELTMADLTKTVQGLREDVVKERESQKQQMIDDESAVMRHALVGDKSGSLLDGLKNIMIGGEDNNLLGGLANALGIQTTALVNSGPTTYTGDDLSLIHI